MRVNHAKTWQQRREREKKKLIGDTLISLLSALLGTRKNERGMQSRHVIRIRLLSVCEMMDDG